MIRLTSLALAALLLAGNASAGLVKAYVPTAPASHVDAVKAAFNLMQGYGPRFEHLWLNQRGLITLAASFTPESYTDLLVATGLGDDKKVMAILEKLDGLAREQAAQAALRLSQDFKAGRIGDDQLSDAQDFAQEFLGAYAGYLSDADKLSSFNAAVALEQRRLRVYEKREVALGQLMAKMASTLNAMKPETAYVTALHSLLEETKTLQKTGEALIKKKIAAHMAAHLVWETDVASFQDAVRLGYRTIETVLEKNALEQGVFDRKSALEARNEVAKFHLSVTELMQKHGRPKAAVALQSKGSPREFSWTTEVDLNDAWRDQLLARIDKLAKKYPAAEDRIPAAAFEALKKPAGRWTTIRNLTRVSAFYWSALKEGQRSGEARKAEIERQIVSGFGGKVLTLQQVSEAYAKTLGVEKETVDRLLNRSGLSWAFAGLAGTVTATVALLVSTPIVWATVPFVVVGLALGLVGLWGWGRANRDASDTFYFWSFARVIPGWEPKP